MGGVVSKYAALLSCITIDAGNKTIRFVEGSTTTNVTLAEGDWYLRGDAASDDLCAKIKTALESNADAANNTYTVSVALSADPAAPTAVVTITRATGAGSFSILWSHASTTFRPAWLGFESTDTAHNGTAKAGTLSPSALWVSCDVLTSFEPSEAYDVVVHETADGRLKGGRRGGPFTERDVRMGYLDVARVLAEENADDPNATFEKFHARHAGGGRFELHARTLSSGFALGALSSSTLVGTSAWHFDEETAAVFRPTRLEPGLALYGIDLVLLEFAE